MTTNTLVGRAAGRAPVEARRRWSWDWVGVIPFFLFALAFLLLPTLNLIVGSFQDATGAFTLQNISQLSQKVVVSAYLTSIELSLVTAVAGGLFGFLIAYAIVLGGLPRWLQSGVVTFSGVASNFAGVPLAFAFISTLGRLGLVSVLLKSVFGIDIYQAGFNLYNFLGLSLTYLYFQIPLMILIITPALEGLRREWREAAENLGATPLVYWQRVALPILLPTILATIVLLFGNAFGAYATAYALTGGTINLVTILIGNQITGDVLNNPGLGNSLSLGMIVIMGLSIGGYTLLQRRTGRWIK